MPKLTLVDSPRLFCNINNASNLNDKLHSPYLQTTADRVLQDADWLVRIKPIAEGEGSTYQHGTRTLNTHMLCLTAAWALTHDPKYRQAAVRHMSSLADWNQISCEANSTIPAEKEMSFCLSYGEHASTIGLMYDLFRADITDDENGAFMKVLDRFYMKAAVNCIDNPPWWAHKDWSNWNGVCAGGIGVMALAFYNDHPDAHTLIPFVEKSLGEYFKSYIKNGGGCHEGTGYWNYGMNYSMQYLLSWETATGKKHPVFKIKELKKTLFFPIDFTGITFGDNDGWGPTPFFFYLASRMKQHEAAMCAAAYLPERVDTTPAKHTRLDRVGTGSLLFAADHIPTVGEMATLRKTHATAKHPVARVYDGLGWAALADDNAFPSLRLAARGGSSEVAGHGMVDLLSFRCRVNGELMITDQQDGAYMPTTFTKRGNDLYGRSAASKSTLFVDGLAPAANVDCDKTEVVKGDNLLGIRIDASHTILPRWNDMFIGRLFLLVDNAYWLIVDAVRGPNELSKHWVESRFHTLAESRSGKSWVSLKSGKERLQMTFASPESLGIQKSAGMPSQFKMKQTTIYRLMTPEPSHDNLLVTGMIPGSKKLRIKVNKETSDYVISVTTPDGQTRDIRLGKTLKPKT